MSVRRPGFVLGAISILLTSAITSCSAPVDSVLNGLGDGNGDRTNFRGVPHEDTDQGQSGQNSEGNIKVAPGTLPPTGEPQPGHARLNADGYYDYTADDFVLGDPCPLEIQDKFINAGYKIAHPSDRSLIELADAQVCIALMDHSGLDPSISIESLSIQKVAEKLSEIEIHSIDEFAYYVAPVSSGPTGICKAVVDTKDGARGIRQPWGPSSIAKDKQEACRLASERFELFIAGALK